jgi:hypothetical protein
MKAKVVQMLDVNAPDALLWGIQFTTAPGERKKYASIGGKPLAIEDKSKVRLMVRKINKQIKETGSMQGWQAQTNLKEVQS